MSKPCDLVPYLPEHRSRVLLLLRHLWGPHDDLVAARFAWKYERNPYLEEPLLFVALSGSEVVGVRGVVGTRWRVGARTEEVFLPQTADAVVAPGHRRQGITGRLTDVVVAAVAERGHPFLVTLSAQPVVHGHYLRHGWELVGGFEPMVWGVRASKGTSPLRRLGRRRGGLVGAVRRRLLRPARRLVSRWTPFGDAFRFLAAGGATRTPSGARVVFEREPRTEEMARLAARHDDDGRIRHVRDARYFAWRFRDAAFEFCFAYWEDAEVDGFLVLRSGGAMASTVSIVDWETTRPEAWRELVDVVLARGRFRTVELWAACLSNEQRTELRRMGFEDAWTPESIRSDGPALLLRSVDGEAPEEWELGGVSPRGIGRWDVRMTCSNL